MPKLWNTAKAVPTGKFVAIRIQIEIHISNKQPDDALQGPGEVSQIKAMRTKEQKEI